MPRPASPRSNTSGTVDCARWPEAQKALINGLRQDPNECVRFAAARALNSGCCCNKKVIDALRICVSGETSDGAPAENSCRVKAAAFSALQNCLMRVPEDLPPEPLPPEPEGVRPLVTPPPPAPERTTQRPAANPHIAAAYNPPRSGPITYDEKLQHKSFTQTVDEARHTLFQVSKSPRPTATLPSGQRSLFGALTRARNEVGTANLRRAREQGLVPPRPDQSREPISPDPAQFAAGLRRQTGCVFARVRRRLDLHSTGDTRTGCDRDRAATRRGDRGFGADVQHRAGAKVERPPWTHRHVVPAARRLRGCEAIDSG